MSSSITLRDELPVAVLEFLARSRTGTARCGPTVAALAHDLLDGRRARAECFRPAAICARPLRRGPCGLGLDGLRVGRDHRLRRRVLHLQASRHLQPLALAFLRLDLRLGAHLGCGESSAIVSF
jgi:hypothetical protein